MVTLMGLFIGVLMALEWLYRLVGDLHDETLPWRHPINIERGIKLLFVCAALTAATPRLILVMTWQSLDPHWREVLSMVSWSIYMVWAPIFASAWYLDRVFTPSVRFQLVRVSPPPLFVESAPFHEKKRAVTIALMLTLIAFATTYVRVRPDLAAAASHHPSH